MRIMLDIIFSGLAVFIAGRVLPGVKLKGFGTAVIVALMLGLILPAVAPILGFLTITITPTSLAIFQLIINGFLILIVAAIVPGFSVESFSWALIFSVALTVVHLVVYAVISP